MEVGLLAWTHLSWALGLACSLRNLSRYLDPQSRYINGPKPLIAAQQPMTLHTFGVQVVSTLCPTNMEPEKGPFTDYCPLSRAPS